MVNDPNKRGLCYENLRRLDEKHAKRNWKTIEILTAEKAILVTSPITPYRIE